MGNSSFLSNQWLKEEITKEITKCFEISENKNTAYKNVWGAAIIVLKEKVILKMHLFKK